MQNIDFKGLDAHWKKQDMGQYYHSLIKVSPHPSIYLQFLSFFPFDFENNSEINYQPQLISAEPAP